MPARAETDLNRWRLKNGWSPIKGEVIYRCKGYVINDVWTDVQAVGPKNKKECLGYPTQKPLQLFERIIKASSNEGDVVLDPFCGCGTTMHAAQAVDRQWIGMDVCVKACQVIAQHLSSHFDSVWSDIEFVGMPKPIDHARKMARMDAFRFEKWAALLAPGMEANKKCKEKTKVGMVAAAYHYAEGILPMLFLRSRRGIQILVMYRRHAPVLGRKRKLAWGFLLALRIALHRA